MPNDKRWFLVWVYIAWLCAEFRDDPSPDLEAEIDKWMNNASKWSGGAGYAGLGDQDVGEIPPVMGAVLAENEEAAGVAGSKGVKIVMIHGERKMMVVNGEFAQHCLTLGFL